MTESTTRQSCHTEEADDRVVMLCPNKYDLDNLSEKFQTMILVCTVSLVAAMGAVGFFYWKNMSVLSSISTETRDIVQQLKEQKRESENIKNTVDTLDTRVSAIEIRMGVRSTTNAGTK